VLRINIMGSLPSLRATGQKMWTRIRPNLSSVTPLAFARVSALGSQRDLQRGVQRDLQTAESEARLQALRVEVERLSAVRSNVERATQLARVLDAVSAMAEAHGLSQAELTALRRVPLDRVAITSGPLGLRQQLKQRATDVVAQVWAQGPFTSISELAFGAVAPRLSDLDLPHAVVAKPRVKQAVPAGPNRRVAFVPALGRWPMWSGAHKPRARSPFVLRVGAGRTAGRAGMQLVAASLLHLPRLHRQLVAVRRGADIAMQGAGFAMQGASFAMQGASFAMQGAGFAIQTAKLVRLQATNPVAKRPSKSFTNSVRSTSVPRPERAHAGATAASLLLWSGRSSLQLTYEIASAGAQLLLRRYVLPRVLRYLTSSVKRREIAPARPLRPLGSAR
jgi:hypothetical protein